MKVPSPSKARQREPWRVVYQSPGQRRERLVFSNPHPLLLDQYRFRDVNREQIAEYQALMEDMRKQVKTWQVVETAAAISAGVALFAGAVIAIYTFGIGIAFGIVGAAAGIADNGGCRDQDQDVAQPD